MSVAYFALENPVPGYGRVVSTQFVLSTDFKKIYWVVATRDDGASPATGRIKATSKTFEDHWVFDITVQNEKLTTVREYVDTQALARASQQDPNRKH